MNKMKLGTLAPSDPKETDMKEDKFDNIVRILVFAGLALFGLRGVLPDFAAGQELPVLLSSGAAVVLVFGIARDAYRCATCAPTCNLKVCRAS
jgi:hypothetical protein